MRKKVYLSENICDSALARINEAALYDALTTGKIAAAALDVFANEPPSPDNPLIGLPNFVGTSHLGASTADSLERVGNIVADNLIRGIEGK